MVIVVVDQLVPSHLDPALPGGLGRIAREGLRFAQARLGYAGTETCPGHVAISTGRFPGPAGVPDNYWVDKATGELRNCVDDPDPATKNFGNDKQRSPRQILVPTLGDRLKDHYAHSRVFAVSGKDRGAIPLAGHEPDGVWWVDDLGRMDSSGYYFRAQPDWVVRFNAGEGRSPGSLPPAQWIHPTGDPPNGARPDDTPGEAVMFSRTSPHPLADDDPKRAARQVRYSPYIDMQTLDFAQQLVEREMLGADDQPDLLGVSLSAVDLIGHLYGPGSQESLDELRRLDARLGAFLDWLEARVGREHLLVALTADHGVLPLPEAMKAAGTSACPLETGRADARRMAGQLEDALDRTFGHPDTERGHWMDWALYQVSVNRAHARDAGISIGRIAEAAQKFLEAQPGVERVWTAEEIQAGKGPEPLATLYRHSFNPERSGDLVVQVVEGCILSRFPLGTNHGTPYLYDREIPLVFWGAGVESGTVNRPAAGVDIAPTLARELGIELPDADGRPLTLR